MNGIFSYGFKGVGYFVKIFAKGFEKNNSSLFNLLSEYNSKLKEKFAVITIKKIRIRNI